MFIEKIPISTKIGIGPQLFNTFKNQEIDSVLDLIEFFPSRYQNYQVQSYQSCIPNDKCLLFGTIYSTVKMLRHKANLNSLSFDIMVDGVTIKAMIFNRDFLRHKLIIHNFIYFEGKLDKRKKSIVLSNIYFDLIDNSISPIYSISATTKQIQRVIDLAIKRYQEYIIEELPSPLVNKYRLISYYEAIQKIHNPKNKEDIKEAARRLKYEEFFKFQLKLQYIRYQNRKENKVFKKINYFEIEKLINNLPFKLTIDQMNVLNESLNDLKSPFSSNRLIQGDVGSGKTIVASIIMYASYLDNYQSALMAPTEILANQHYKTITQLLPKLNIVLLTSLVKGKARSDIIRKLKSNEIDIIIGTHSLIEEGIIFHNLGVVITDEQHKFGVNQRQLLRKKGKNPDVFYLTATPIPRTLALSLFGDMDISSIKTMPLNRIPIITRKLDETNIIEAINLITEEIKNNHQIYIIAPLIEESKKIKLIDVNRLAEKIKGYFPNELIGLLHGRLKGSEKEKIMDQFNNNHISILVSTTVIEVGLDNKNATVMMIFNAEAFGLSQLHQLRGRVGRSDLKSYCFLIANEKENKRLDCLVNTTDGFLISEEDLSIRGPGDFFGNKQSGIPKFKIADVMKDYKILECAKEDALEIINNELWRNKMYYPIKQYLKNELENSSILD